MKAKRFKDLSPSGKLWASIGIAVSLILVVAAERDIQHRPSSELKGSKAIWRLICLNAIGALSYFRWGRRA
jgi:hypothetical protein